MIIPAISFLTRNTILLSVSRHTCWTELHNQPSPPCAKRSSCTDRVSLPPEQRDNPLPSPRPYDRSHNDWPARRIDRKARSRSDWIEKFTTIITNVCSSWLWERERQREMRFLNSNSMRPVVPRARTRTRTSIDRRQTNPRPERNDQTASDDDGLALLVAGAAGTHPV